MNPTPDEAIVQSLLRTGLVDSIDAATFEPLTGGVSSDIWRVQTRDREFCVKRALSKLKVEADWFAPVERNLYEVAWFRVANEIVPGAAPVVIAHDKDAMICSMEFLDPATHRLWKNELRDGRADSTVAAQAGQRLGRIHAGTAGRKTISPELPPVEIFHAIRLEPYLEAVAHRHADLKDRLFSLSRTTAEQRLTMIHGDVSPKNILIGPDGPVFIDAECACIGDPAFDLAFCLNHFLLKCLWKPDYRHDYQSCFHAMCENYLNQVDWEDADDLQARAAGLLPGLYLARVDGKSPVEYLTEESDQDKVRRSARALLFTPTTRLAEVADVCSKEFEK